MSHRSIFFVTDNNLQITEAFRTLRTNLAFLREKQEGKLFFLQVQFQQRENHL